MKNSLRLITFLLLLPNLMLAQIIHRDPAYLVTGSGLLNTRTVEPEIQGKTVLFERFKLGDVYLSDGKSQKGLLVDYDIYKKSLVVLIDRKEYELRVGLIDSVVVKDTMKLENRRNLPGIESDKLIWNLHLKGSSALFKGVEIEVMKPTYNAVMHVGSRDYVITKVNVYYFRKSPDKPFIKFFPKKSEFLRLGVDKKIFKDVVTNSKALTEDATVIRLLSSLD